MTKYLAPHLFIILHNGNFVLWDCESHSQFEVEISYLERLQEIDKNPNISDSPLDKELLESGIITTKKPNQQEWGWDPLSRLYHVGTKDVDGGFDLGEKNWIESYLSFSKSVLEKNNPEKTSDVPLGKEIPLSKVKNLGKKDLWKVIQDRKTTRNFNGQSITKEELSTLLFMGFGKIHGNEWEDVEEKSFKAYGYRRAHPSGGSLQPVQGYVMVFNVQGIPSGVYYYCPERHALITLNEEGVSYENLSDLLCGQFFSKGVSVGIIPTAHFEKAWHKYQHSRAYKDVYLDCGHLSQTILLAATALKLRTWITAWYKDSSLSNAIGLEKLSRSPLLFLGIGHGEDKALPKEFT